jgi:aryl-alcohol dehydrogenase-like predicted oxidoreductase
MTALARIGLGTVQFGMNYGVSNRGGRPQEREVTAILARAVARGVGYLDTAPAYGDAEALLGRLLPEQHGLHIITKTPPVPDAIVERRHGLQWLQGFERSLDRLRVDSLYGLLVHRAADLGKPGWEHLVEVLHGLKSRGMVGRIGVSIYDEQQLDLAESRFGVELVQLPLNALDRRPIVSGLIARLKAQGSEIHARSVFLQGLLLMPPSDLKEFFEPVRPALARLNAEWAQRGLSPLAACLAFVLRQPEIDAAVVGVNSLAEFDQIADAVAALPDIDGGGVAGWSEIAPEYLDPSRWPAAVH